MMPTRPEQVLDLVRKQGVLRSRDLKQYGIARKNLAYLYRKGLLERLGRGLYALPNTALTEHHSLAEVSKRIPAGVICLLSALRYHALTTQAPFEVWMAIPPKMRQPQIDKLPVRIVRFSGQALTSGIEEHVIEGVRVSVYSPAKTVADCFKYRYKIGLDVALEALRDVWRQRKASMDELWRYAEICRVANVMKPYMESLV